MLLHSKQTENQKSYFFHLIQSSIIELGKIPYNEKNPKHFIKSSFGILLSRYLADSNCRTRFCRPLTKPLIQGTNITRVLYFLFADAKVALFLKPPTIYSNFFSFFSSPHCTPHASYHTNSLIHSHLHNHHTDCRFLLPDEKKNKYSCQSAQRRAATIGLLPTPANYSS